MRRRFFASVMAVVLGATVVTPAFAGITPYVAKSAPAATQIPGSPTDSTKVPHYFGPYSNWANSPQALSAAVVTFGAPAFGTTAQGTAVVNPATGAIDSITITVPGSGYTVAPGVLITSPGVTPTTPATATSVISTGVVTSVVVNESGFGFTTPSVAVSGGGIPSATAFLTASGGVDNVTIVNGGSYTIGGQAIVVFDLPSLPTGVQATGTATINAAGVITDVTVTNPGSGYTTAPGLVIWDGLLGQAAATPATATSTIGILQIDVTNGGAGYDSVPVLTITDSVAPLDKGATATATVAALGAVTSVVMGNHGAGYLTAGLKKFVDTLPGLGPTAANSYGQYIPVAVADTTTYPGTDYYEIAVVQYRQQFSSQLPATLLRGYVQLSTAVVPGNHVALTNATMAGGTTPILGYFGVDNPHYLGPTIVASRNKPVRILFRNLLPTGVAGNLFLPVDTSLMGSGMGPDMVNLDANNVPIGPTDLGTVMDGVRNPACGEAPKPADCYSENRATLHLHGGLTPWISDGTPHQWVTPAGEATTYPKGVSVSNVPDMPDPGAGAETFFYTNQQSARLMFYHDHAWGITRLNVYAGEAAGYLLTDTTEQTLISPTGALAGLGVGTPLIIQDKTFVPANILTTDPTWNSATWGGTGSLWTPHVYMPAQNPGDPSGMSAFGRWMYGPWFWPPAQNVTYPPIANPYYNPVCDPNVADFCEPALIPSTPNISVGMEAFNDTPIVNGTAYPTTTVDPKAYRYRILNAANDRFWNLQWYVADPTTGTLSEVALKPAEVLAAQTDPNVFPTPDLTKSPVGPSWIQIGTEGGFLPAPVIVPNQPTTWIIDPTRFDVGNVDKHSLLLAPAERADVIVDFAAYRGKTLILYNDAPAAFPARVSSYDYYTGGPDLSPVGAPTTLPGYGPNTRTIMQVKVSNAAPAVAFDRPNTTSDRLGALVTAFAHHADGSGVFESDMDPIIVGQAAYNSAYGTSFVSSGWCNAPGSTSTRCDGFARIAEGSQPTDLFGFNTLAAPTAKMQIPFEPKGMHDEMNSASFDDWGRMTANLGLEAPGATPLLQNITLFPYVNPTTEFLDSTGLPSSIHVTPIASAADGTQIWKMTHNGVDTHPIHFHLFNVQVINRVTWDNIIIPPEATELGWKDTVRVSPLEDTIVAVRPISPTIPFGVLDSHRPLNPSMPIGAQGDPNSPLGTEAGFNNSDALGNPIAPIVNEIVNFGWEYVFHCHILSHEEMDMMRPMNLFVARTIPDASVLSRTGVGSASPFPLTWTDPTAINYLDPTTWGSPKAEVGYRIERATLNASGVPGAYASVGLALANQTSFTDLSAVAGTNYAYRVVAYNAAGETVSNTITTGKVFAQVVVTSSPNPSSFGQSVTFTATVSAVAPGTGTPTGTVQFAVDNVNTGAAVTLNASGQATISISTLSIGSHGIRATYSGSTTFVGGATSPTYFQTVTKAASTTVLTSSVNPSVFGQPVTFTATVTGAGGTPGGTVQFKIDSVNFGAPVTLNASGVATSTSISSLSRATHTVTALYSGNATYAASNSSVLNQVVNRANTTTAVTSSVTPSVFGQSVTFTATVAATAPGAGTPTGTVQFSVDGTNVGAAVNLNASGQAALVSTTLAVGSHTVRAVYAQSNNFNSSTSPNITQVVNKATVTVAVTSNLNPSHLTNLVTFTATVTPVAPGAGVPGGTVQFAVDGVNFSTPRTMVGNVATIQISTLTVATHGIRATYIGNASFAGGPTSPTFLQQVLP